MKILELTTKLNEKKEIVLAAHGYRRFASEKAITTAEGLNRFAKEALKADELSQEHVWVVCFHPNGKPIGYFELAKGGRNQVMIDCSVLFGNVLLCGAFSIALIHNHPGGTTDPSREDEHMTRRIGAAAELLGIVLLDHLIVASEGYFSMRTGGYYNNKAGRWEL